MASERVEHSEEWYELVESRPVLRRMTRDELNELFEDAEPRSDDDVPFRFPVKVPVSE